MTEKAQQSTPAAPAKTQKESSSVQSAVHPLTFLQRTAGNRAVSAVLADRGEGAPLPDGLRGTFEPLFAHSFADVRIHSGPRAADLVHGIGARAFTRGSDIYLGENADRPSTIAHELAHTVQQDGASPQSGVSARGDRDEREARDAASRVLAGLPAHVASGTAESAVQRDEPPEGYELSDDPDHPLKPVDAPEHDEDALPGEEPLTFPVAVSEKRPELLIVPEEATRRDIARVLLGDEARDGEFDFFAPPEGGRAVRLRNPDLLVGEGRKLMREKLDAVLDTDVARVAEILGFTWIDDANEWELAESVLRWSQRSNIHTEDGTTYFDKYLDRLYATPIGDDSNALVEIIDETENKSEQVLKAIDLRGVTWSSSYEVTDTRPAFAPGDVVGRFYFSTGSGVQLKVVQQLAAEPTLARAELIVRNTAAGGLRVVIPGSDGVFYGYLLIDSTIRDPLIPLPHEDPGGNYYWYYPGTVAVLPGTFEADAPAAPEDSLELRRGLLDDALEPNDIGPLLNLDFTVMAVAKVDERVTMLSLALADAANTTHSADFIARVIYTTPDSEFPTLERRMTEAGLTEKLVIAARFNKDIAAVGRIFSIKTMSALPIGAESIRDMPSFTVGYDEDGTYHLAWAKTTKVESQLIAADEWDPASAIRVGHEPAAPDETPGPVTRQAIIFEPAKVRGGLGAALEGIFQVERHIQPTAPATRPLLPTELVQIHEIGPQPKTVIVSALEASALLTLRMDIIMRNIIAPVADVAVIASGGLGLLRAFGPALAGGLARGGVRAILPALGEAAATHTGKAALRSALITGVLVGGSRVIDAYREELEQTPEGRALIAAWNVAMLALIAKDVYAIAKSGIIGQVAKLATSTYATLSAAAARRLRNAIDDLRALELAAQRFIEAEKKVPALAAAGVGEVKGAATMAAEAPEFGAMLMAARAEVRSATLVTTLREAGASTTVAERVFKRLQELSDASKAMARAQKEIASHASTLAKNPAALDDFLIAVELTVGTRANTAGRLAGFLRAATKSPNPVAYLDDVRWLLSRGGVGADAIETLGDKAARGRLDLGWLKTTSLTDRDLSYLGANPNTPWDIFQKVAGGTATHGELMWAQRSIRGIAAEITARRNASAYFPGDRISASQKNLDGSIIDFVLTSTEGLARRRGLEVKGFTRETWQEVLAAFSRREAGLTLTADQAKLAERIDRMLRQLENANSALGRPPVLAISDKIRAADETALRTIISARVPGTEIVKMSETTIVSTGNELRTALGITP